MINIDTATPNLAEQAYLDLRNRIMTRRLPAGPPLIEERLARSLELSRTPLREALIRLLGEGLLVKFEGSSYAVRRITAVEYFQSMKVRLLLEPEAAARAAGQIGASGAAELKSLITSLGKKKHQVEEHWAADDRLHGLIADASGNIVLARTIQSARTPARLFELTNPFQRVAVDCEEHLAILDAAVNGDAKAAARAMQRHLHNLEREMRVMVTG
ncbi:MAG: GntR family transcriptional regulator [Alphaproteobacteria bacterium]|nr:GntR family transcriptional regulator [Alphaproteobacteria bacterium]